MSVRVMDESRQSGLGEQIKKAAALEATELVAIVELAAQLDGQAILPVVGAGASFDCGVRLAREIGGDLLAAYQANDQYKPWVEGLKDTDLGEITEAIHEKAGPIRVVEEMGIPEEELWRPAAKMGEHFCVYRVLARLVKEGYLKKTFGFNYDCGAEAGLGAEGVVCGELVGGGLWLDNARVIADAETMHETEPEGAFLLVKAHGCAERYREVAGSEPEEAAEAIVVRTEQLKEWKNPGWSGDEFRGSAKKHVVVLIGFSGQDPKFGAELGDVLGEVFEKGKAKGRARVVAIDLNPSTDEIDELIEIGLGGEAAAEGQVTRLRTNKDSSATAALLVLLAELLARRLAEELDAQGVELPEELDARLASLVVSVPTMLRWAFACAGPVENGFIQLSNQMMLKSGYVPVGHNPSLSVKVVVARARLRERLGMSAAENSVEALANDGFLVPSVRGRAYLPVGFDHDELVKGCPRGDELAKLREALAHPEDLDCILVSGDGSTLRGVSLKTGEPVDHD
jgi:hypothetical protein